MPLFFGRASEQLVSAVSSVECCSEGEIMNLSLAAVGTSGVWIKFPNVA